MSFNRVPVHRIEYSDVRNPALVPDAVGDILERGSRASGEVHLGVFPRVRPRDRGADGATAPVDDRGAVLQQHYSSALRLS
jgi:hypothetical protein